MYQTGFFEKAVLKYIFILTQNMKDKRVSWVDDVFSGEDYTHCSLYCSYQ